MSISRKPRMCVQYRGIATSTKATEGHPDCTVAVRDAHAVLKCELYMLVYTRGAADNRPHNKWLDACNRAAAR